MSAIIAYVQSLTPVDQERAPLYIGPLGRILHVSGMVTVVPAEVIDHTAPRPETVARAATQEYGAYLAKTCTGVRPDGSQLSTAMPWPAFQQMTNEEIQALWLYLQSVPAQPYGNR